MKKTKKKALALLRVSSEAQAGPERGGLPGQRRASLRIAEQHQLEIVEEIEVRISGARVLEDPEFRRMMRMIEDPSIVGLIVSDLDRLMRPEDPTNYSIFARLRDTGTVLYTNAGIKDYRSDRLLMTLEAEIAALERQRIAERTRRGREEKRRQGFRAESAKVGMPRAVQFSHETKTWSYVWPEAEKIRLLFALFLGSHGTMSFRELARRTELVPERYGEPSSAVRRVLTQPLYAGIYRVHRKWVNGKAVPRDAAERYEVKVIDEPLVSEDDFARVQALVASKRAKRSPRKPHDEQGGTYAGFLECSICGASICVVPDSLGYKGYLCGNSRGKRGTNYPEKRCSNGQVSVRAADHQIDEALSEMLGNKKSVTAFANRSNEDDRTTGPGTAEATRKLAQLHNQEQRIKDAYEAGVYDLRECKKRLARVRGELSVIEELIARDTSRKLSPEVIQSIAHTFYDWRNFNRETKRKALATYQIRIAISKPRRLTVSVDRVLVGLSDLRDNPSL